MSVDEIEESKDEILKFFNFINKEMKLVKEIEKSERKRLIEELEV